MTPFEQAKHLHDCGYYIGPRDPNRNKAFHGAFMVCENISVGETEDAGSGGFCIVGDDLLGLIWDAYHSVI